MYSKITPRKRKTSVERVITRKTRKDRRGINRSEELNDIPEAQTKTNDNNKKMGKDGEDSESSDDSGVDQDERVEKKMSGARTSQVERPPKVIDPTNTVISAITSKPGKIQVGKGYYHGLTKQRHQKVIKDLRDFINAKWYSGIKFITNDDQAKRYIEDATSSGEVMIPSAWTREEFRERYQIKMFKAFTDLRHNCQLLARKNYLRKHKQYSWRQCDCLCLVESQSANIIRFA